MSVEIKGFKLPPLLVRLMEEGKWVFNGQITLEMLIRLYEGTGIPLDIDGLAMLGIQEMKDEEEHWKSFDKLTDEEFIEHDVQLYEMGLIYGKRPGYEITDSRVVDLDFAVTIALDSGGEAFYLDYRENPDNPRVMTMVNVYHTRKKETDPFEEWREIAPDFETFARKIGLVE